MMKPMSEVQRNQLADEYWKWFEENELKKWMVFTLKDSNIRLICSNNKNINTNLIEKEIDKIFNEFPNDNDKNWSNATHEFKVRFEDLREKALGKKIHGNTNNKTVLENIIKPKYEKFDFDKSFFYTSEIKILPEIQYKVLRKYIYVISQKLIGKRENKKLTWEKRINLILKKILIMEEKEMNSFILNMEGFKVTKIKHHAVIDEEVSKKVIKDFFISSYERMRDSEFKHKFLFKYFPVCPYCNATYLFKLREEDIPKKITNYVGAQLDHYYPKDKHPYLAVLIFNLIPSCPTCNHIKSNREESHLHPYFETEKKYRNIMEVLGTSTESNFNLKEGFLNRVELKIKSDIDGDLKDRIKNSQDIFQLENKYSGVREEIRDLYFKHKAYNGSQKNELIDLFGASLGINESEIDKTTKVEEIFFGARKTDPHKRPLSKFINDIRDFLDDKDQDNFE